MENNFKKKIVLKDRTLKYKGSIMEIYDDVVDVAGHEAHWDFMKKCDAAAVIPILPNGKILMVRQCRLAVNENTLEVPAGKLDNGEDFLTCAYRELEEETGYKTDKLEFLCDIYTAAAFTNEVVRIYLAENIVKGMQHFDQDEETIVEEWDLDDLKRDIYNGKLKDSKTIAAILAYSDKRRKDK